MTPAPQEIGVVVGSQQSERLLTLLQRHGFSAHRIDRGRLDVHDTSTCELRRFALLFGINVLLDTAHRPRTMR